MGKVRNLHEAIGHLSPHVEGVGHRQQELNIARGVSYRRNVPCRYAEIND
jgi:hypothetical protein